MKNRKIIMITLILIGIVMIISGGILSLTGEIKEEQTKLNARMDVISKEYSDYTNKVEEFDSLRTDIYTDIFSEIYYDSMGENDTAWRVTLNNYTVIINDILTKNSKILKDYCVDGIYYSSGEINTKCNDFRNSYEEVINYYVSDIELYNSNIHKYNKYLDDNGITTSVKLNVYDTNLKYIDYNKDGKYSGREEAVIDE